MAKMKYEKQASKRAFLERVARMYYILGYNQQEISEQLNVGRSSVARFLGEAKKEGVIQFTISSDFESWRNHALETQLMNQCDLKECVIFQSERVSGYSFEALTGMYLNTVLPISGMVGLGWGRTLYAVGQYMHLCEPRPNVKIVQLSGGSGAKEELVPATTVVQLWSTALRSRPIILPAPAVVDSPETKKRFLSDPSIMEVLEQIKNINVAVVGIGHTGPDATIRSSNLAPDLIESLFAGQCVGDIMFHFYDWEGKFRSPSLSERVIGASIEDFLNTDLRIGIAKGVEKSNAIKGALNGRLVHVLITTEETAKALLA